MCGEEKSSPHFLLQHAALAIKRVAAERIQMLANAVFVATLIFLALGFWMMSQMHFLIPWRSLIVHAYLQPIATYCALLFANILGLTIWIERKFFLRDTGRKLKHLDQEIHSGHSELSEEITAQFGEE
jgi:ABC-type enterochelin transport system permease subunit